LPRFRVLGNLRRWRGLSMGMERAGAVPSVAEFSVIEAHPWPPRLIKRNVLKVMPETSDSYSKNVRHPANEG
jgi:hypothetical protein